MKICHYCGTSIANNAKTCKNCWKKTKIEKASKKEIHKIHEEQFQYNYNINSTERKDIKDKESFDKSTTFWYSFRLRFWYLINILYCLLWSFCDEDVPFLYFLLFIIYIIFWLPYHFNRVYLWKEKIYIVEKNTIFSGKKIIWIPYTHINAWEVYYRFFTRHFILLWVIWLYKKWLRLYLKWDKKVSVHFLSKPGLLISKLNQLNTNIQIKIK